MQITDNAKVVLEQMMKEQNMNALTFAIQEIEGQPQLSMDLAAVSEPDMVINGLNVMMDYETFVTLQDIMIDFVDGRLVLYNTASSCGCGGCGGDCQSDDSCGCGGGCSGCC